MIYNYTSSKEVIAKVFSDLDLQEDTHRIADMMEWIGEGMEKIGAVTQLEHKSSCIDGVEIIEVKDYQATLPSDIYRLDQVAFSFKYDGEYQAMRYATGGLDIRVDVNSDAAQFDYTKHYEPGNFCRWENNTWIAIKEMNIDGNTPIVPNTPESLDYWKLYIPYSTLIVGAGDMRMDLQYYTKPGYLVTNVRNGWIKLSYYALRTDSDGLLMIPDMASFKEALYWYINMKLSYIEWRRGTMKDGVYYDAKKSWNFYRQQAYAEALMPGNADQMQTIQNVWNRIIPDLNEQKTAFASLGQEQKVYNEFYGRIY